MAAAEVVARRTIFDAEELRTALRLAEVTVANLRGMGAEHALSLLHLLDAIEEAIPRLESEYGIDLKPERTRLTTVENLTRSRAAVLVREVGRQRLAERRRQVEAAPSRWWWYLDLYLAQRRQERFRRWGLRAMALTVILLVAALAYQFFLAPSPEQQALSQRLSEGESLVLKGELEEALQQYQAALELAPDDPSVHLYLLAIYEELGEGSRAAEHYEEAKRLLPSAADFHANLSLVYFRMASAGLDTVERAEEQALAAVEADEDSAMAHFALASAYELQGRVAEAIGEFELASNLSDDPSMTVLARMRMGMLMQRPGDSVGMPGGAP